VSLERELPSIPNDSLECEPELDPPKLPELDRDEPELDLVDPIDPEDRDEPPELDRLLPP
jgi:hypothetical protein